MASEAARALSRIASNYARLAFNLAVGLAAVPILIGWLGLDAFGLLSLVGATTGLAALFRELTQQSLIRELGAAWHTADGAAFRRMYASAWIVSACSAAITAIFFVVLLLCVGLLDVGGFEQPARAVIAAQGVYACLFVLTAPVWTMYAVLERFGWQNFWTAAGRATQLLSAIVLAWIVGIDDVAEGLVAHGLLWSALLAGTHLAAIVSLVASRRTLRPSLRGADARSLRAILHTFGWNSAVVVSQAMHYRVAAIVMNLAYGVLGNAVFELGFRLAFYVRMAVTGTTHGLEAVSARLSAGGGEGVRNLLRHSARIQAVVAMPACLAVIALAEPILSLWVGSRVEDPDATIPLAANVVRLVSVAVAAGGIAHGWLLILYGAGHVRRYAPMLLAFGIASPLLGIALLGVLDEPARFYAPGMGYATAFAAGHLFGLPLIGSRALGVHVRDFFSPLVRPAIVTALASPVVVAPALALDVESWTVLRLAAVALTYGALLAILVWAVVATPEERSRVRAILRRSRT